MKKFSVSEVIDSLGVNRFTWHTFFLLGFAMIFDGYDNFIVSFTMPQIAAEWSLNSAQTGSLSSWGLLGLVIGGVLAGVISDKLGRRRALVYSVFFYGLLTIPIYFAQSYSVFAICRVLTGIGLGACIPVVVTILSESVPTNKRALFISLSMALMVVGSILAGVLSIFIIPAFGWRLCYLIGGIPVIYSIFLHFKMKESSYWLANKGRKEEAVKILEYIETVATGKSTDRDAAALEVPMPIKTSGAKALFSKDYRKVTIGLWIMFTCGCFCIYGISAWLPLLMLDKGFALSSAYMLALANNFAAFFANSTTGFGAEKFGRKKNIIAGFLLTVLALVLLASVGNSFGLVFAAIFFMGFVMSYGNTAMSPIMAESYPTGIRNTGVAWCQAFGRLGGALAPVITGIIVGMGFGYSVSILFYIIPVIIIIITVLVTVKETKGKSLDQLASKSV